MDVNQALSTNQVNKAKSLQTGIKNGNDKKLLESCQDFESMFIKQMLDSMKKTINKSGLIKENMGEKIFDDMLYDEYAKKMATTSNLGIAKTMYKQLSATKYQ